VADVVNIAAIVAVVEELVGNYEEEECAEWRSLGEAIGDGGEGGVEVVKGKGGPSVVRKLPMIPTTASGTRLTRSR
jgi:hypothetical protein